MSVSAVVFDLGNTLWFQAKEPDLDRCFSLEAALIEPLLRRWGIAWNEPLIDIEREIWATAEASWVTEAFQRRHEEVHLPTIIRAAMARREIDISLDQATEWWRVAWISEIDLECQLYPDAIDVLRDLRAMGIRIGLNSNRPCTGDMLGPGLRDIGLAPYVDVSVCSGDTGFTKPHRSTFDLILERLGTAAADTVMVGDSCAMDVVGAKSVGMLAVLKLNGRYDIEPCDLPDYTIHDLGELLALPIFEAATHARAYATESLTPHDDANDDRY